MAYQRGSTGKPEDLRSKVDGLLHDSFELIVKDFAKLTPKERVSLWLKMAEFNLPRLRYFEGQKVLYRVDGLPENHDLSTPEIIEIPASEGK